MWVLVSNSNHCNLPMAKVKQCLSCPAIFLCHFYSDHFLLKTRVWNDWVMPNEGMEMFEPCYVHVAQRWPSWVSPTRLALELEAAGHICNMWMPSLCNSVLVAALCRDVWMCRFIQREGSHYTPVWHWIKLSGARSPWVSGLKKLGAETLERCLDIGPLKGWQDAILN